MCLCLRFRAVEYRVCIYSSLSVEWNLVFCANLVHEINITYIVSVSWFRCFYLNAMEVELLIAQMKLHFELVK